MPAQCDRAAEAAPSQGLDFMARPRGFEPLTFGFVVPAIPRHHTTIADTADTHDAILAARAQLQDLARTKDALTQQKAAQAQIVRKCHGQDICTGTTSALRA